MNRRTRKPAAGMAISNEAQAWPRWNVNQAAAHNATSGKTVIASSAMLRTRLGVLYSLKMRCQRRALRTSSPPPGGCVRPEPWSCCQAAAQLSFAKRYPLLTVQREIAASDGSAPSSVDRFLGKGLKRACLSVATQSSPAVRPSVDIRIWTRIRVPSRTPRYVGCGAKAPSSAIAVRRPAWTISVWLLVA